MKNLIFVSAIFILSCSTNDTSVAAPVTTQPTEIVKPIPTKTAAPTPEKPQATATTEVKPTAVPTKTSTPKPKFASRPNTAITITPTKTIVSIATQTPVLNVRKNQIEKANTDQTPTVIPDITPSPTITPISADMATPEPLDKHIFAGPSFTLTLNEEFNFDEIDYETIGLQSSEANSNDGVFKFDYSGSSVVLYWLPSLDITPEDLLGAAYQLLTNSQPENDFMIIGEGDLDLSDTKGKYGAFVISDEQGDESGGGIIGAWTCHTNKTNFAATVLSVDATVLQIRFDKLVTGFECATGIKSK